MNRKIAIISLLIGLALVLVPIIVIRLTPAPAAAAQPPTLQVIPMPSVPDHVESFKQTDCFDNSKLVANTALLRSCRAHFGNAIPSDAVLRIFKTHDFLAVDDASVSTLRNYAASHTTETKDPHSPYYTLGYMFPDDKPEPSATKTPTNVLEIPSKWTH